jgi:hypothetical protein
MEVLAAIQSQNTWIGRVKPKKGVNVNKPGERMNK